MIILGIDPGSLKAGYALIQVDKRKFKHLESGVLYYPKSPDFISKLGIIYQSCTDLIQNLAPDEISIESLIFVKNISSLTKLSQARGAMLAAFNSTHCKKIYEYSPTLIKSSVTGHGQSNKSGVQKALNLIFGKIDFESDDQSDALAIALTHALNKGRIVNSSRSLLRGQSLRDQYKGRI